MEQMKADDAETALTETEALTLALNAERLNTAELMLAVRRRELEGVVAALRVKYEDGGEYTVVGVDPARGTISRQPRSEVGTSE